MKIKQLTVGAFLIILTSLLFFTSCRHIVSINTVDRKRIDRFTSTMDTTKTALVGIERELRTINRNARKLERQLTKINSNAGQLETKLTSLEDSLRDCQSELNGLQKIFGIKRK